MGGSDFPSNSHTKNQLDPFRCLAITDQRNTQARAHKTRRSRIVIMIV